MVDKASTLGSILTRQTLLVAAVAALLGYLVAARGTFKSDQVHTPLAVVGHVLRQQAASEKPLQGDADDWRELEKAVVLARKSLKQREQLKFDLVARLNGLESRGQPQWAQAAEDCKQLAWPRCDRQALEAMQKRSQP